MIAIVERHLKAEGAGDIEGAVASTPTTSSTTPSGSRARPARQGRRTRVLRLPDRQLPHRGRRAAQPLVRRRHDVPRTEHDRRRDRRDARHPRQRQAVTFRIFHVFEFHDGLICREQVWIDTGAIVAQLTAAEVDARPSRVACLHGATGCSSPNPTVLVRRPRPRRAEGWDGIRSYQARNYLREMKVGRPGDLLPLERKAARRRRRVQDRQGRRARPDPVRSRRSTTTPRSDPEDPRGTGSPSRRSRAFRSSRSTN